MKRAGQWHVNFPMSTVEGEKEGEVLNKEHADQALYPIYITTFKQTFSTDWNRKF